MMLHFQETSFVVAPCMYSVGRVHCFSSNKKRVCSTSTVEIRTNIAWGYYYTFAPFREWFMMAHRKTQYTQSTHRVTLLKIDVFF